jgi:sulfhydrogenase subunit beta (sulfur reductase)
METTRLTEFTRALRAWGAVWAPVSVADGVFALQEIHDPSQAQPAALRTTPPFKKLLLRPAFTMLRGAVAEIPIDPEDNLRGPHVYFGAHACDIHALKILDLLYLSGFSDPYYRANRERLTVVGFGCWPDQHCFCQSLDTSTADDGFDLFLTQLGDRIMVAVGTWRGDDIVRANPHLFEPATRQDSEEYLDRLQRRRAAFQLELDTADLPFVLDLKRDDLVWHDVGTRCVCCGSCSMVCPTCSCFNVADVVDEDGRASRVRTWDSCLFPDYAVVAGGHSFRADRADRVRNRYYHKQDAFVREFGMPSCVGCGRCIENCPTGINVVEVFRRVRGEA